MHTCKICGTSKPLTEFYKDNGSRFGYRRECKTCMNCRNSAWKKNNKEKLQIIEQRRHIKRRESVKEYQRANRQHLTKVNREWRKLNPDKTAKLYRRRRLKAVFGLTLEDYEVMLRNQDYSCYICKKLNAGARHLAVDHCHKTGEVRKLLCGQCNSGLGMFKDNVGLLIKAAKYLKEHADAA